jgi:hypothetical protein
MKTLKPKRRTLGTPEQEHEREKKIAEALLRLNQARVLLRECEARMSYAATLRAIKSTEGAARHARCCYSDAYYVARRLEGTA